MLQIRRRTRIADVDAALRASLSSPLCLLPPINTRSNGDTRASRARVRARNVISSSAQARAMRLRVHTCTGRNSWAVSGFLADTPSPRVVLMKNREHFSSGSPKILANYPTKRKQRNESLGDFSSSLARLTRFRFPETAGGGEGGGLRGYFLLYRCILFGRYKKEARLPGNSVRHARSLHKSYAVDCDARCARITKVPAP